MPRRATPSAPEHVSWSRRHGLGDFLGFLCDLLKKVQQPRYLSLSLSPLFSQRLPRPTPKPAQTTYITGQRTARGGQEGMTHVTRAWVVIVGIASHGCAMSGVGVSPTPQTHVESSIIYLSSGGVAFLTDFGAGFLVEKPTTCHPSVGFVRVIPREAHGRARLGYFQGRKAYPQERHRSSSTFLIGDGRTTKQSSLLNVVRVFMRRMPR